VPSVLMASQHMMESEVKVLVNAFPDIQSPNSFESEYDRWLSKWRSNKEETARITGFAEACFNADSDLFPGIHTVLKVSATRPSSTASNERCFSAMKRLKTYLRSTMTEDRLTGLAMMHIHNEMYLDVNEVIDQFAKLGQHRLAFL